MNKNLKNIVHNVDVCVVGGGIGAMFGMVLFNHKTSKTKFRLLVPLYAVLSIALVHLACKFI